MRLHRFIIQLPLGDHITIADENMLHQWVRVLRIRSDDYVIICDGQHHEATYQIATLSKLEAQLVRIGNVQEIPLPHVSVHLYAANIKRENFEWIVQKVTELGVTSITPIVSERTVKTGLKNDRLERIISEAVEQSGRGTMPILGEQMDLEDAIEQSMHYGMRFLADMNGEKISGSLQGKSAALFIGPEGGWSDSERKLFTQKGIPAIELGQYVLRAETAAIVGVAHLMNL